MEGASRCWGQGARELEELMVEGRRVGGMVGRLIGSGRGKEVGGGSLGTQVSCT